MQTQQEEIDRLRAEVERVTKDRDEAHSWADDRTQTLERVQKERDVALAESAKLREALEELVGPGPALDELGCYYCQSTMEDLTDGKHDDTCAWSKAKQVLGVAAKG